MESTNLTINRKLKWVIFVCGLLLLIDFLAIGYFYFFNHSSQESLLSDKVIFLNVGQGDSILFTLRDGKNILVDGGPSRDISYRLDKYLPLTNRQLDLIILTHPDPDHLNGLVEVLDRYSVKEIISNGVSDPDLNYLAWQQMIKNKNIPIFFITKQQELTVNPWTTFAFFWPQQSFVNHSLSDDNRAAIGFVAQVAGQKFLLASDLPTTIENKLISENIDLSANLLKVGHHGSKYSTSPDFLNKIKPQYAVISVGQNDYGHPSLRVLKNLEKIKAKVLRTDQKGDIIFTIKDNRLNIKTIN